MHNNEGRAETTEDPRCRKFELRALIMSMLDFIKYDFELFSLRVDTALWPRVVERE